MSTLVVNKVLHQIQRDLKAPKSQFNSFGKYSYRSCEDILEELKKHMPEGCFISLSDEVIQVGERYYIRATAKLTASDGSCFEVQALARESLDKKGMDDSQITGTASSYARKYALNGLFAIDDTKDADTQDNSNQSKPSGSKGAYQGKQQQQKYEPRPPQQQAPKTNIVQPNPEEVHTIVTGLHQVFSINDATSGFTIWQELSPHLKTATWNKLSKEAKQWIKEITKLPKNTPQETQQNGFV